MTQGKMTHYQNSLFPVFSLTLTKTANNVR